MTTKRTPIHRATRARLSPEILQMFVTASALKPTYFKHMRSDCGTPNSHCEDCRTYLETSRTLHSSLGLYPHEVPVEDAEEEYELDGSAYAESWPKVREIRNQLEAALQEAG